jgi:hypothetical protein
LVPVLESFVPVWEALNAVREGFSAVWEEAMDSVGGLVPFKNSRAKGAGKQS